MPEYTNRKKILNDADLYADLLEERNVDEIVHFKTFFFNKNFARKPYVTRKYVWSQGDKLYKLAARFYGDHNLWWIIALWNNKPTDAHFFYGDIVSIPFPPDQIVRDIEG